MLKTVEKFVPVLVDGASDKEFGTTYGVSGYPMSVFADPKGKKVDVIEGYVETPQFLDQMKAALKKIGPVQLKKAAKELQDSAAVLAKAREKNDWKGVIRAALAIEKIGHDGREMQAARDGKKAAGAEGGKRFAEAKKLKAEDKLPEARAALVKIVAEFDGLDVAVEAKKLLQEIDDGKTGAGNDKGSGRSTGGPPPTKR